MSYEQLIREGREYDVISVPLPQLRPVDRARGAFQKQVYRELKRVMMIGAFMPGQTVSLRTLAKRLGTSPMPVRDAVNRLIAERALEMLPNRSVVVPILTRAELTEITMLRQMLEGKATEQACAVATPSLIAELRKLNDLLIADIKQRDDAMILERNQTFHFTLYQASGYQRILPMIEMLWLQVGPVMNYSVSASAPHWDASHHTGLLDAMAAGDPKAGRLEMERDIQAITDFAMDRLGRLALQ